MNISKKWQTFQYLFEHSGGEEGKKRLRSWINDNLTQEEEDDFFSLYLTLEGGEPIFVNDSK